MNVQILHSNIMDRLNKEVDIERLIFWIRLIQSTTAANFPKNYFNFLPYLSSFVIDSNLIESSSENLKSKPQLISLPQRVIHTQPTKLDIDSNLRELKINLEKSNFSKRHSD